MKAIHNRGRQRRIVLATALAVAAMGAATSRAADNLPSLGGDVEPWKVDIIYENDTRIRGKDNTGHRVGLSKFRNTLQVEADKKAGDGWGLHGVLRGTWDGVYRLNKDEYGKEAGSKTAADIQLSNTAGPVAAAVGLGVPPVHLGATVPFGGGVGYTVVNAIQAGAGLPNLGGPAGGPGINRFIDPNYANLGHPAGPVRLGRRPASAGPALEQHRLRGRLRRAGAALRRR